MNINKRKKGRIENIFEYTNLQVVDKLSAGLKAEDRWRLQPNAALVAVIANT